MRKVGLDPFRLGFLHRFLLSDAGGAVVIWILQWLFVGHVHKWKTIDERVLKGGGNGATGSRYIQQCERCGIVVKRDLI